MLHPGLYEQVINNALTGEFAEIPEARKSVAPIDKAEASKVLAQYLADVVQKGLDNVLDNGGDISAQIGLTNQIVDLIQNTTKEADFAALGVDRRAEQLLALLRETDPRLAVCQALGVETMPVIVRELSDDEAVIAMVDANLQRETKRFSVAAADNRQYSQEP